MIRYLSAAVLAVSLCLAIGRAQDVVPVNHGGHQLGAPVVVDGGSCANGNCATGHCATGDCGKCSDCVRITEIKKTQHPVYSCKVKEVCIPNCGLFGSLFGCKADCQKIEVRQLVKKYRTDEECHTKCVTQEEAAKHYEEEAKKAKAAAEKAKTPAPAPVPAKLMSGPASVERLAPEPAIISETPPAVQIIPSPFRQ